MPGVDGAVKLNNKVIAPKSKTTETELTVSEFKLPIEEKVVDEPIVEEIVENPIVEEVENAIETPFEEVAEVESEISEVVEIEPQIVDKQPKIIETIEVFDIKKEFDKATMVIKKAYDKVFSKSQGFKPEFGETVGDMILYLSAKLKTINASGDFDKVFGLVNYTIPQKYSNNYIPLAIKLAVWCKSKGVLDICDELLFELSSVYIKSAKNTGVTISEEDIQKAFFLEINEVFNK